MADEVIDFDAPVDEQQDATSQQDVTSAVSRIASLNARAVMPDGRTADRSQILATLGLNPNTSPTAWLTIAACGVNASALRPGDLQRIAVNRLSNASAVIRRLQDMSPDEPGTGKGFVSGGSGTSLK